MLFSPGISVRVCGEYTSLWCGEKVSRGIASERTWGVMWCFQAQRSFAPGALLRLCADLVRLFVWDSRVRTFSLFSNFTCSPPRQPLRKRISRDSSRGTRASLHRTRTTAKYSLSNPQFLLSLTTAATFLRKKSKKKVVGCSSLVRLFRGRMNGDVDYWRSSQFGDPCARRGPLLCKQARGVQIRNTLYRVDVRFFHEALKALSLWLEYFFGLSASAASVMSEFLSSRERGAT